MEGLFFASVGSATPRVGAYILGDELATRRSVRTCMGQFCLLHLRNASNRAGPHCEFISADAEFGKERKKSREDCEPKRLFVNARTLVQPDLRVGT